MSGIAGIYHLNGSRVDPEVLTRMTDVIAHRGPDGVRHWIDGAVGLGHRRFLTTPEALREEQPLLDETGNLCLTLDGRVDNRDELRDALDAGGARLRTDTDAELVLRAYQCWGDRCPDKIIGDFAFAIWDGQDRRLFCARDPLGIKPFYYYNDGRTFLFGSESKQLFACETVQRKPNEGMIGEYLADAITDKEETLYQGIFRLPPAHFLSVGPEQRRKERYWAVDPAREIRYRTDEEYAEHFRAIFKEAVRCRLRSHGPVGAHLSGGLDSSSVVVTARALYREGLVSRPGFETFSAVYPGLPCDERPYIDEVSAISGFKSNTVVWAEPGLSYHVEQLRCRKDFPGYPNEDFSLQTRARERGFRVLLTGVGGNQWLEGTLAHLADLLRSFRCVRLIRQACFDSSCLAGNLRLPRLLLAYGLGPLLSPTVRRAIKRVLGRRDGVDPWINPLFARRTRLLERIRKEDPLGRQFPSFAQKAVYLGGTSGREAHVNELNDHSASWFGLEERHPFHDRRVVELALALPEEQRWRQDQTKFILRHAMRNHLPEKVRRRVIQAEFSVVVVKALQDRACERLFDSLAIASMGWIDQVQVRGMYQHTMRSYSRGDAGCTAHMWALWMIAGIELWFRTAFLQEDMTLPC